MTHRKILLVAFALLAILSRPVSADPGPEEIEFFEKKIRPVLAEHCFKCHSGDAKKLKGGLLLDSRAGVLKGGESGSPALVAGHPEKSKLIEAIRYTNVDLQMPPRAKLPDAVIADLTAWVKMGAPWGKESGAKEGDKYVFDLAKRKREHWAWQSISVAKVPAVKNEAWPLSDADRFILAQLEEKGLTPAPAADPRTLVRRLHFDLIGLPPSPAEVETFLRENGGDKTIDPAALEKLVDRLLASPHFGERWARRWLDLVRYAESRGHEFDYTLPNAYQYRDYVIRALNLDVPYNQFVIEHLAGDLEPRPRLHPTEKFNESILGTGFWFLGEQVHSPVDICQDRADRLDNKLDVMSKTFLGLTVACARCHDHKFDAISAKDYYALAGFLESSSYRLVRFESQEHNRDVAKSLAKLREESRGSILKALAADRQSGIEKLSGYLLAARDVRLKKQSSQAIAGQRKLDAALLDKWLAHLAAAAKDVNDPFHAWARIGLEEDAKRFEESRLLLSQNWSKSLTASEHAMDGAEVVIDYARREPKNWIQDGEAFGPRPVRPGDVRFGTDPLKPITHVYYRGAAQADPIWSRLKNAPGSENEPGALDRMNRAGRTLRTPTFKLKTDRVWCLVEGAGTIYASVEGHVMIAGPLHGELVTSLKPAREFHWVALNLGRYKGLRAHIEFTPAPDAEFAVAMVVQAETSPAFVERPRTLVSIVSKNDATPVSMAADYQRLFQQVTEQLASGVFVDGPRFEYHPWLADWLVKHPELFADAGQPDPIRADTFKLFFAEQARLIVSIRSTSRLAPAILDGNGVDESIFIRGSYKTPGELTRRFLEAFVGTDPAPKNEMDGSGRLQLARQMIDPNITPLVPRVMVNRIWHHLFGRGIVASTDNFGLLGERPTHPELLDNLADQFAKDGWSIKKTIRRLVLTRTYQMSSHPDDKARQIDPQNLLLQHARIRRLEGEAIRDSILFVGGSLDAKMFGPAVPVYLTQFQEGRGRPGSGPLDGAGRRSIYLGVRRNFLSPLLLAFDTPIPFSSVGRRSVSNVPAQALILLNDPFVHQQAGKWAQRVVAQEKTSRDRITAMYQSAFGRPPNQAEADACLEFLDSQARLAVGPMNEAVVWTDLAHVLFNAKEFIYLN